MTNVVDVRKLESDRELAITVALLVLVHKAGGEILLIDSDIEHATHSSNALELEFQTGTKGYIKLTAVKEEELSNEERQTGEPE